MDNDFDFDDGVYDELKRVGLYSGKNNVSYSRKSKGYSTFSNFMQVEPPPYVPPTLTERK